MKNLTSRKGFTLIELLIVITIIGILAVALLPSVLGAPARARDAARKADINNIVAAIETYNSDNQHYPETKLCIGKIGSSPDTTLADYFQAGNEPTDPQGSSAKAVGGCDAGTYLYCPIPKYPHNYYVAAYVEIPGDGNTTLALITGTPNCSASGDVPNLVGASQDAYIVSK